MNETILQRPTATIADLTASMASMLTAARTAKKQANEAYAAAREAKEAARLHLLEMLRVVIDEDSGKAFSTYRLEAMFAMIVNPRDEMGTMPISALIEEGPEMEELARVAIMHLQHTEAEFTPEGNAVRVTTKGFMGGL